MIINGIYWLTPPPPVAGAAIEDVPLSAGWGIWKLNRFWNGFSANWPVEGVGPCPAPNGWTIDGVTGPALTPPANKDPLGWTMLGDTAPGPIPPPLGIGNGVGPAVLGIGPGVPRNRGVLSTPPYIQPRR